MVASLEQLSVEANGLTFSALAAGDPGAPLALCLHGFPDSLHTWRHLLPELGDAGFRAVAPAMRGYEPTGPAPDGRYQRGALVADALALHEALGGDERAVLIGHDWGAMAAYGALAAAPERWRRGVTMAVPPMPIAAAALGSYEQAKRSFYIWLFQTPLAESMVAADDLAFVAGLWDDWTADGYDTTEDLAHTRAALAGPANVAAAIGYYRAMFDPSGHDPALAELEGAAFAPVPQPVLYLHGRQDRCLVSDRLDEAPAHLGPGSEVCFVDGAGHFLHVERPDEVGPRVVEFLTRG